MVGYGQEPAHHHPLVVIDGKTVDFEKMKDVDPKTIESIDVHKDKSGIEKYGEKAKNGVIVITTKNKK